VIQLTSRNLATLNLSIEVSNRDYRAGLSNLAIAPDQLLIAFIAPPWGDALNKSTGLDLRRTTPPITEIVDFLGGIVGKNPLLCAIQVYETLDPASLAESMSTGMCWLPATSSGWKCGRAGSLLLTTYRS
jgi:hypothetical protein